MSALPKLIVLTVPEGMTDVRALLEVAGAVTVLGEQVESEAYAKKLFALGGSARLVDPEAMLATPDIPTVHGFNDGWNAAIRKMADGGGA